MQSSSASSDNKSGQKSSLERFFTSSDGGGLESAAFASVKPPADGVIHGTASRG